MIFSLFDTSRTHEVTALFTDVFSASEGETEGRKIGALTGDLISKTQARDLIGCMAIDNDRIVGCIFFSRLIVPRKQTAFLLSPVAVATSVQGTGIGQQLIRYGLEHLKHHDVSLVFTYGDPAFYSRTGFEQISETLIKAPFTLSQPEGWLAQSLDGRPLQNMQGETVCVGAFNDPSLW